MTTRTRDWRERNQWIADLLKRRTGQDLEAWNARVREAGLTDEAALRAWLTEQGVMGYPQSLLVMERFGYPDSSSPTPRNYSMVSTATIR